MLTCLEVVVVWLVYTGGCLGLVSGVWVISALRLIGFGLCIWFAGLWCIGL